jgi:hypothetical protein
MIGTDPKHLHFDAFTLLPQGILIECTGLMWLGTFTSLHSRVVVCLAGSGKPKGILPPCMPRVR